jgi:hypothetical protein
VRVAVLGVDRDEGEELHGLSKTHVVGEHAAESDPVEEGEPGEAPLLVGPERAGESSRR